MREIEILTYFSISFSLSLTIFLALYPPLIQSFYINIFFLSIYISWNFVYYCFLCLYCYFLSFSIFLSLCPPLLFSLFISISLYFFQSLISISIFIDLLLILVIAFSYSWWVIFLFVLSKYFFLSNYFFLFPNFVIHSQTFSFPFSSSPVS